MVETRHEERVLLGFEQDIGTQTREKEKISFASPSGASDFAGGKNRGEF